jgi:hypothetical protein
MKRIKKSRVQKMFLKHWGFNSVEERLPGKCKVLSSVPSTEKKKGKIEKKKFLILNLIFLDTMLDV